MAFDGLITRAIAKELSSKLTLGKIEKIYQPDKYDLVFHIHTKGGKRKLFASANSSYPRLHLTEDSFDNPTAPGNFCMLLRKYLQGGRIEKIEQHHWERIIEISFQSLNELGFTVSKKLIFEIMGKHSNIILVDANSYKILDCIKRVGIDVNRARQLLPGLTYVYPPVQEKIPFDSLEALEYISSSMPQSSKDILNKIGGISPRVAEEIWAQPQGDMLLESCVHSISAENFTGMVFLSEGGDVKDFHIMNLSTVYTNMDKIDFPTLSKAIEYFFSKKAISNRLSQKKNALEKKLQSHLDKLYLKNQRLEEDLLKAENSEHLRLFGELITANLHSINSGAKAAVLENYYDGSKIEIPLDVRLSPSKNAQIYYKKYSKAMISIKEKTVLLESLKEEIDYLESVSTNLGHNGDLNHINTIEDELRETGYIKSSKDKKTKKKAKNLEGEPLVFKTTSGLTVKAGKNNKENDFLTLKIANKEDLWFHTKDIPGSHVVLFTEGKEPSCEDIKEAAAISAYYSKASASENVPVDYVKIKYVKKPAGSKPGMVIFKNNKTIWINPGLPK